MLGNAEFVVLLQQKKDDWNVKSVTKLFDLSESQASYLKTGEKGSGLIICGQRIIPFQKKPIQRQSALSDKSDFINEIMCAEGLCPRLKKTGECMEKSVRAKSNQ